MSGAELWTAYTPKHLHAKKRRVLRAFRRAVNRGDHRAMSKWVRANTKLDCRA